MEGLPSGDIQGKYQKLASEYSKLRVHVKVLKKGVLDEQAKCNELRDLVKEKEKVLRRGELEVDSLTFRNQQLTKRISVLQDELEALQMKLSKKSKFKGEEKPLGSISKVQPLDSDLLQEELQKKILESAQIASQLSDKTFEVSQLKATLEDYQKHISEGDSKYKCEIAKLKNKNQELQLILEENQKERLVGTPSQIQVPTCSQPQSCNGDFLSEGGSLIGSEDALSSVDDLNLHEQMSMKTKLRQESQNLRMELELVQMENQYLKLELSRLEAESQKRKGDHDSGDFNNFNEAAVDAEGKVTGLLGSLVVPLLLSQEVLAREERIKTYFRNKISELKMEKEELKSKTEHYVKECEMLRLRFDELERDKELNMHALQEKHDTITRLEEELHSTSHNYEEQMSVLTEHVAGLNEQLASQHDQVQVLKHQLSGRKK